MYVFFLTNIHLILYCVTLERDAHRFDISPKLNVKQTSRLCGS